MTTTDTTGPAHPTGSAERPLDLDAALRATALHRDLGLTCEPRPDGVTLRGQVPGRFARADGMNQLHGGAVATLLDTALTYTVVAATNRLWSTVDLRVDYLRPVPLGAVEVVGTVVQAGSSIGRARADLIDGQGRLCATGTATFAAAGRARGTGREERP